MHLLRRVPAFFPFCATLVAADRLTGSYPPPLDLSSNTSLVTSAWKDLASLFDQYLIEGDKNVSKQFILTGLENVTFGLGVFSLHDPAAVNLEYHYTAPEVATALNGTNKVDGDSIYQIASVSKLITTYTAMLSLSEADWNRPLTEINPDFNKSFTGTTDPIWNIQWDKITPMSLATQLSGLPTIGFWYPTFDLYNASLASVYGAPQVDLNTWSSWVASVFADPSNVNYISLSDAIATIANIPPNFQPWTTPAYSDLNFMLLGSLTSNITNQSLPRLYHDTVFGPLEMTSSSIEARNDTESIARSVIPYSLVGAFTTSPAFLAPSGGVHSTIHDLQKLCTGILNHTLLSPEATRKWMKPTSHTSSLTFSVGAPWEIARYVYPNSTKVTDLYTKSGSSGPWGGEVVIIPEYDAGFVMLAEYSGAQRGNAQNVMLDYVTNYVLPALEAQAAAEAKNNLVGTYTTGNASIPNTSITIGYEPGQYGQSNSAICVTSWTYNGTNVLAGPFFTEPNSTLYLEPSIPNPNIAGAGQIAFQAGKGINYASYMEAFNSPLLAPYNVIGPFMGESESNMDFFIIDYKRWAGVGLDMFVFDVDADGRAMAVTAGVDRVTLSRAT